MALFLHRPRESTCLKDLRGTKNAHLKEPANKKQKKQFADRNLYHNLSLMVGSDCITSCGDSDSASEYGQSTVAGFDEADAEKLGMDVWKPDETARDVVNRFSILMSFEKAMMDAHLANLNCGFLSKH